VCKDDYIHEMGRYGGSGLHAIASIIGGCAAQEAIKLITKQYVPVNKLFI
jgi:amyloid beta precursor protein binding protein 1